MIEIREDDLSGEQTRALLAIHLAGMHANSPADAVFALDLTGLQAPGITVWSAWDGDSIAGIGALNRHGGGPAEIKSMRTHPDHLRKGVARILLARIIDQARSEGIARLNLETGRGPAFEPALALYRAHGFVDGPAFGAYAPNPFSQFLYLEL